MDSNGENPVSGMVVNVDSEGVVTCSDDELHGLSTGNSVTFVVSLDALFHSLLCGSTSTDYLLLRPPPTIQTPKHLVFLPWTMCWGLGRGGG